MIFRTRDLLVGQRTQLINAVRGHLAERGIVDASGLAFLPKLKAALTDPAAELPPLVRSIGQLYLVQIDARSEQVARPEKTPRRAAAAGETAARLQTMPGIGPIGATAIKAFAPEMTGLRRGRGFAAWVGLVPLQRSTGGRHILGRTSKMGQRGIRRLPIIGAMTRIRWALAQGAPAGSWLARMLARKPRMLVAIALANKMARSVWAMMAKGESYRDPVGVA